MSGIALYCEIDPLAPREKTVKRVKLPEVKDYTIEQFHKDLEKANSKKMVIDAFCKFVSRSGGLSGFGESHPEAYKRLQDMRR